jgi:hypothetical protein
MLKKMEDEKNSVLTEKGGVEEELETLKKEQEDLLVLLADQDTKIENYKKLLKENNIPVSSTTFVFLFVNCKFIHLNHACSLHFIKYIQVHVLCFHDFSRWKTMMKMTMI